MWEIEENKGIRIKGWKTDERKRSLVQRWVSWLKEPLALTYLIAIVAYILAVAKLITWEQQIMAGVIALAIQFIRYIDI